MLASVATHPKLSFHNFDISGNHPKLSFPNYEISGNPSQGVIPQCLDWLDFCSFVHFVLLSGQELYTNFMKFWIAFADVDGVRLDAAKHVTEDAPMCARLYALAGSDEPFMNGIANLLSEIFGL
eukprot:5772286-Amphidinium_carterae.1